jgi:hypothetical protein
MDDDFVRDVIRGSRQNEDKPALFIVQAGSNNLRKTKKDVEEERKEIIERYEEMRRFFLKQEKHALLVSSVIPDNKANLKEHYDTLNLRLKQLFNHAEDDHNRKLHFVDFTEKYLTEQEDGTRWSKMLFADDVHLNEGGAELLAKEIVGKLPSIALKAYGETALTRAERAERAAQFQAANRQPTDLRQQLQNRGQQSTDLRQRLSRPQNRDLSHKLETRLQERREREDQGQRADNRHDNRRMPSSSHQNYEREQERKRIREQQRRRAELRREEDRRQDIDRRRGSDDRRRPSQQRREGDRRQPKNEEIVREIQMAQRHIERKERREHFYQDYEPKEDRQPKRRIYTFEDGEMIRMEEEDLITFSD